jgi:hypothetical protein
VRFEDGQLAEMWFGMDSLVEMQQMGVAPTPAPPELSVTARANLEAFHDIVGTEQEPFDNVAAFDDAVVSMR